MLFLEIQGTRCDLSTMRISYKLMKRTTKTEKFEKFLKKYNIINFKTIQYSLIASGNISHFIFIYTFRKPVSFLRLPKERNKKAKTAKSKN